jgi:BirA family biotin operon repressor/biotin-[acetyl-CoA-carboxylase] ligase
VLELLLESGADYASGEALSGKLGLSRTAVWKMVNVLRDKGYGIEAVPSRGYRLLRVPDRISALELLPRLETHDLGRTLHAFDSLGSTSEHAFRLASEGAEHGELVIAEQQTAGRGRRGRSWSSPAGKNLYASLVLRPELPPQRAPELTLLAAVAVAEALNEEGWRRGSSGPTTSRSRGGRSPASSPSSPPRRTGSTSWSWDRVNLNAGPADFPPELVESATSVLRVRGKPVDRPAFTARLMKLLEEWLDRHAEEGFLPIRARWRALSATLGQEILVKSEHRELRGLAEDIDTDGALILRTDQGKERILAGDVEQVRSRLRR